MENQLSKTDCRSFRNNKPLTAEDREKLADMIDESGKWRKNIPEEKIFTTAERKRTVSLIDQTTSDIVNHPDMGQEDAVMRGNFERKMKAAEEAKEAEAKNIPSWALTLMQSYNELNEKIKALQSK